MFVAIVLFEQQNAGAVISVVDADFEKRAKHDGQSRIFLSPKPPASYALFSFGFVPCSEIFTLTNLTMSQNVRNLWNCVSSWLRNVVFYRKSLIMSPVNIFKTAQDIIQLVTLVVLFWENPLVGNIPP
jgi:hypothetical protein